MTLKHDFPTRSSCRCLVRSKQLRLRTRHERVKRGVPNFLLSPPPRPLLSRSGWGLGGDGRWSIYPARKIHHQGCELYRDDEKITLRKECAVSLSPRAHSITKDTTRGLQTKDFAGDYSYHAGERADAQRNIYIIH